MKQASEADIFGISAFAENFCGSGKMFGERAAAMADVIEVCVEKVVIGLKFRHLSL